MLPPLRAWPLPARRAPLLAVAVAAVLLSACSSGEPALRLVGEAQVAVPVAGSSQVAMTLVNDGDGDDRLVSVTTDAALSAEIHRTTIADGAATMETLTGLDLPAGERIEFRPGELHLMLVVPDETVREGGTIELVLDLERSDDLVVEATVVDLLDLVEGDEDGA